MQKILLVILCIIFINFTNVQSENLVELFKWKQIEYDIQPETAPTPAPDFVFPDTLKNYRKNRNYNGGGGGGGNTQTNSYEYIAYNNVPMGVTHYKDKLFLTVPRRRVGIPSTLNYVSLVVSTPSPKLKPFPNFAYNKLNTHRLPSDESFISVYRVRVDACERLWFIDTGMLEYPDNRTQVQQPSIWIFDLKTNQKIRRFEIPSNIVNDGRGLASITIDADNNNCDGAYAYIPDLYSNRLYVYSFRQNHMWSFQHNYFSFDPLWGNLNIANQTFQWNDGIFSITLSNKKSNGFRTAYFHPMCSISEFAVSTEVLQNEPRSGSSYENDFHHLGFRGPWKQSTMHDYDPRTGIIVYAEISTNGIGCWNTNKNFSEHNHAIIDRNEKTMIYPSDLQVDSDGAIWMMTNSMPLFIYSSLNPNEYNFRVWTQSIQKATANTVCDPHFTHNYK